MLRKKLIIGMSFLVGIFFVLTLPSCKAELNVDSKTGKRDQKLDADEVSDYETNESSSTAPNVNDDSTALPEGIGDS